mmetsp:Transcript_17748/g.36868  ORF Transcript_17748/g.36868 Transcript_17748/m.36868 type:complete len:248 (+) Transcript_17748:1272-2015(+)
MQIRYTQVAVVIPDICMIPQTCRSDTEVVCTRVYRVVSNGIRPITVVHNASVGFSSNYTRPVYPAACTPPDSCNVATSSSKHETSKSTNAKVIPALHHKTLHNASYSIRHGTPNGSGHHAGRDVRDVGGSVHHIARYDISEEPLFPNYSPASASLSLTSPVDSYLALQLSMFVFDLEANSRVGRHYDFTLHLASPGGPIAVPKRYYVNARNLDTGHASNVAHHSEFILLIVLSLNIAGPLDTEMIYR